MSELRGAYVRSESKHGSGMRAGVGICQSGSRNRHMSGV